MDIKDFEPLFLNWYVDSFIGSGSFGKVYKIKREEFGVTYYSALKWISIPQDDAELKQLRYDGMDDASISEYYKDVVKDLTGEIQLMSRLRGRSSIVSYEDHRIIQKPDEMGYDIFIRMELLTSLNDYMLKRELSRAELVRLGIDLCEALELCQRYNIIHRDIKPDNIFVTETGDFKLGDFGIARQLEKTATGLSKKGTYNYMAPEVYKGERYNSSVDLYSLGIVLYRLLNNGRLPFLPQSQNAVRPGDREQSLVRRMSGEAMPMPQHAEGRLGEIILKACAFDPKDRYSSPKQMREELEAIQFTKEEAKVVFQEKDNLGYIEPSKKDRDIPQKAAEPEKTGSVFSNDEKQGTVSVLDPGKPQGGASATDDRTESVLRGNDRRAEDTNRTESNFDQKTTGGQTEKTDTRQAKKTGIRVLIWSLAALAVILLIAILLVTFMKNPIGDLAGNDGGLIGPTATPAQINAGAYADVASKLHIAMITDTGNLNDMSYNEATWNGCSEWAAENGTDVNYYSPSEDSDEARIEAIETAINRGANVIICPEFAFAYALQQLPQKYPEVMFLGIDLTTADVPNLHPNTALISYREEQAGFLAGYAAVMDGNTKLAFIGGMAVPAIVRYGYGFVQGANQAAIELGNTDAVFIKYWYADSFEPTAFIYTNAQTWYQNGTQIIFPVGGGIINAVIAAAEVENGKLIGFDTDQSCCPIVSSLPR